MVDISKGQWVQLHREQGASILYRDADIPRRYLVVTDDEPSMVYDCQPSWWYATYQEAMDQIKRLALESLYEQTRDALSEFETSAPGAAELLGTILAALKGAANVD